MKIIKKALGTLKKYEFITVATADKSAKPHCAPKLLLKIDNGIIYFIDFSIGKTIENLRVNPEASLSFIDAASRFGYRLNGSVEIIDKGKIYDESLKELHEKEIELFAERVVRGVQDGKAHKDFESEIPESFLVYKIKVEEGCEINPRGEIKREIG
ncbi:MAG: pyridoxamine 5'-phosphate oxidase family protein [Candidatus Omnitrophota bacterium]